jgi:hypothetical protein
MVTDPNTNFLHSPQPRAIQLPRARTTLPPLPAPPQHRATHTPLAQHMPPPFTAPPAPPVVAAAPAVPSTPSPPKPAHNAQATNEPAIEKLAPTFNRGARI